MLSSMLPNFGPPSISLLPFDRPELETAQQDGNGAQQQHRRRKGHGNIHMQSPLKVLEYEERLLDQRKLAIAMYGYSWLKPAGCNKTMLGIEEETRERDEVERQLREVEMQERNAAEAEEAERQAQLDEQRAAEERGEDIGEDRDLDDEVPDMDADEDDEEEDEEDYSDEEGSDIEQEEEGSSNVWVYDTTRDPDTEDEGVDQHRTQRPAGDRLNSARRARRERAEEEAAAQAMLDQDEMDDFDDERDLDDDIPDEDLEPRNLDSDIPDADEDDGGWEHTDTELDESDMDISIMPPGVTAHQISVPAPTASISERRRQRLARESLASEASSVMSSGLRRTSGNIPLPMGPPAPQATSHALRRGLARRQLAPHHTPDQMDSDISVSALISTGNTVASTDERTQNQRAWLDPNTARRNLFGTNRNSAAVASSETSRPDSTGTSRQFSSGGLFTPPAQAQTEPQSRTRSGRIIGQRAPRGRFGG